MMKNTCIWLSILFAAYLPAQSPIVLGNSNMPGNNDTLRYTNVLVTSLPNYTATGTGYNWNFSGVTSLSEGVRSFKSALLTPYAFFFLGFNEYGEKIADTLGAGPLTITQYYNYYRKLSNPAAFVADGVGLTINGLPVPSYFTDKDELYNFPLTYPKYDSTTFRFSTATTSLVPVKYSKSGYRVSSVDGWGVISTPDGTANCLRLVTTQYAMDTVKIGVFPVAVPNVQRSYQWLTSGSRIPYFEITGSLINNTFAPSAARYRGYNKVAGFTATAENAAGEHRRPFPNPAGNYLEVDHDFVSYRIFDLEGRLISNGSVQGSRVDVSVLVPGVYLLKLEGPDHLSFERFVKE